MTTRAERTLSLFNMPERLLSMVNATSKAKRLEIYRAALRHYPIPAELNDIAREAPEWLEVRDAER